MPPALFNVFLDHTLRIALDKNPSGVKIRYTLDGEVYVKEYDKETEIEELGIKGAASYHVSSSLMAQKFPLLTRRT